ncbi:cupin domain-containing protein [Paraburkholderia xenovorans]|uniref:cupin domain-containing protein n=1 Tax=Paraburkholderia xenovorans TaxID=36873 RepID=UPI0038BA240B
MTDLSVSKVLVGAAASAAALDAAATVDAASSGNQDRPREGRINAKSPTSMSGPGPQSRTLAGQFPSFQNSPATHVNGMPLCWTSFSNAHTHYQNGGWAGEVTQDDFAIAEEISGVSVCLAANGVREIHWHEQAKWAIMVDGKAACMIVKTAVRSAVSSSVARRSAAAATNPPGL